MSESFDWGEPIFSYSRKQAIDDGVLVDLSGMARDLGFKHPVACTQEAWHEAFAADPISALETFHAAIRASTGNSDRIDFMIGATALYALCGPGDTLAPVLTVMMPWED